MASSNTSFVEELYEQFLVCRVCSKQFRHPKVLICLHTFCCECLKTHYESEKLEKPYRFLSYTKAISCPICRSKTEVPMGGIGRLPDNFLVDNLNQVVNRCSRSTFNGVEKFCEICQIGENLENFNRENRAVLKCIECSKHLCQSCSELHRKTKVTQFHALFDIEMTKEAQCKIHRDEFVKFFCETCDECICIMCAFHHHKEHDVFSMAEVLETGKETFFRMLKECGEKIEKMSEQIKNVEEYHFYLKKVEEKIRESATETVALIRQKERELISQLKNSIKPETLNLILCKDTLEKNLKTLETAFNLTSIIANSNSVDFLLTKKKLKKQMSDALNNSQLFDDSSFQKNSAFEERDYFEILRKLIYHTSVETISVPFHLLVDSNEEAIQTDKHYSEESDSCASSTTCRNATQEMIKGRIGGASWQKSLPVIEVVQNNLPKSHVILKPAPKQVIRTKDSFTEMNRTIFVDKTTSTPVVLRVDRETTTGQVQVMHKNTSTINQVTKDKSTCTTPDVCTTYRSVANVKRQITVSRGTLANPQVSDKETSTFNAETFSRGTSPGFVEQLEATSCELLKTSNDDLENCKTFFVFSNETTFIPGCI